MAKYLDNDGLLYFWQKIKTIFALKTELPTKLSDLTNDGNFVTDASYVHTDNNFTTTLKNKLNGVATGAEVNVQADWNVTDSSSDAFIKNKPTIPEGVVVDSELSNTSTNPVQNKIIYSALGGKVDAEAGKGLSTNDYTTAEKNKLSAFGDASTYALKSDISGMYKYKGSVATASALPTTGQTVGDVYNIEAASTYGGAGMNVAWDGEAWDPLGEIFSITSITNAEIDTIVAA